MFDIAVDAHMIGDHSGGNESYYTNAFQAMEIPVGISITLLLNNNVDDGNYKDKYKIIRFKSKNALIRNFIELPYLCFKYKFDLLHTQYFIPFVRPCKVICTIHDICFEHFKDIFTKKEYYLQKILIPYAAKKAEYILTVSEHAKRDIASCYHIDPNKIIVTYSSANKVFHEVSKIYRNDLINKFKIGDKGYILSVCNLQPRKNLVRLIKAYGLLYDQNKINQKLVIVGKKAWMYSEILSEAARYSTEIIFTDYVTDDDLVQLYNFADCFVYPSFFEGFGLPPVEAMACGTPVVVSKETSLPEVVENAGVYFDPYDTEDIARKIYKMLNEKDNREKYRELGFVQAQKFTPEQVAKKIACVYTLAFNSAN